jgi:hypothetical protein
MCALQRCILSHIYHCKLAILAEIPTNKILARIFEKSVRVTKHDSAPQDGLKWVRVLSSKADGPIVLVVLLVKACIQVLGMEQAVGEVKQSAQQLKTPEQL